MPPCFCFFPISRQERSFLWKRSEGAERAATAVEEVRVAVVVVRKQPMTSYEVLLFCRIAFTTYLQHPKLCAVDNVLLYPFILPFFPILLKLALWCLMSFPDSETIASLVANPPSLAFFCSILVVCQRVCVCLQAMVLLLTPCLGQA